LAETLRKHGIFPAAYYSWKKKFDAQGLAGLKPQYSNKQMKALRDLEQENTLLTKLLAEKDLELAMAKEVIKKKPFDKASWQPIIRSFAGKGLVVEKALALAGLSQSSYYHCRRKGKPGMVPSQFTCMVSESGETFEPNEKVVERIKDLLSGKFVD
jgi:hypothetical protein